ncbi:PEGA domain protein [Candidatus Magnetobacterium bavaricum]|uniref:PEGA domain protein n=1 Tax=Candidatus Magnetobacterium bavaricum TaxID=29290 RepID=A0A0F3GUT2_9BACT|nr:PEGA domain protein [Candidatus Magnetobacterium bavaricum]
MLEKHLAHKRISLDNRIALDQLMTANKIDKETAIALENNLRGKLNIDKINWEAEYKENYTQVAKGHPNGIPADRIRALDDTYVSTGRVTHRLVLKDASAIKKGSTPEFKTQEVAQKKPHEASRGQAATHTQSAHAKKGIYAAVALVIMLIVVGLFFMMSPGNKPTTTKSTTAGSTAPAEVRYGYINVWSRPSAEVFIDGASVGQTPLARLKVRAGKVSVNLVNTAYNINAHYEEDVVPE